MDRPQPQTIAVVMIEYQEDERARLALTLLHECGVQWSLMRLFYQTSYEFKTDEDGIERRYVRVYRDPRVKSHMYLKDEAQHLVECKKTGIQFHVSNVSDLNFITLNAMDDSWRWCFMLYSQKNNGELDQSFFDENDGSILITAMEKIEGHRKKYGDYARLVREKVEAGKQHSGFKIVEISTS